MSNLLSSVTSSPGGWFAAICESVQRKFGSWSYACSRQSPLHLEHEVHGAERATVAIGQLRCNRLRRCQNLAAKSMPRWPSASLGDYNSLPRVT